MAEETKKVVVKKEKKAKVKKDLQYRVQSGKFWHQGESWYLIYSEGLDGSKTEKRRVGPFKTVKELQDKLVKLTAEAKPPVED